MNLPSRAELKNRLYRRRCMNCGFLGAVPLPDSSRALGDLGEVTAQYREHWAHRLRDARDQKTLRGSEYDPVMGQDLGLDVGTPFGVMCGVGRPEGPQQPMFIMPRRRGSGVLPRDPGPGYVIRDPSQPSNEKGLGGLLGKIIAAVQTPIWPLARPHACPAFLKHQDGMSPAEHVTSREGARRWKRDAAVGVGGVVLGAVVSALMNAWLA